MTSAPKNNAEWNELAETKIRAILRKARAISGLKKLAGKKARSWNVHLRMVGGAAMARLNHEYRGKDYPTDVLSFPAPEVFREQGILGELVICVPVLKRQAKELGHRPDQELQVLLVHGVLHLLGMDHELGPKEAKKMALWEERLLGRQAGLIHRNT